VWMVEHHRFGGSVPCYTKGAAVGVGDRSAKPAHMVFRPLRGARDHISRPTLHRTQVMPCSSPSGVEVGCSENCWSHSSLHENSS
jgi:hypothetical protein